MEVQNDFNFHMVLAYLASFAHDLPRRKELEATVLPVSFGSTDFKIPKEWIHIIIRVGYSNN
jgi:hypothetical protein